MNEKLIRFCLFDSSNKFQLYKINLIFKRYLTIRMELTPNKIFLWKESENQQSSSEK